MPDQDIYNRHIPRNWQTAARIAFTSPDDELVKQTLLRALGKEVKQGGCPGIDEIVVSARDFVECSTIVGYQEITRRLDRITRRYANERTYLAREAARKIVLDISMSPSSTPPVHDERRIELAISKAFLAELAISKISSLALAATLAKQQVMSAYEYVKRQERILNLLNNCPEIEILAQRLVNAPQGHGLRAPRVAITKLSTEESASYQLTE